MRFELNNLQREYLGLDPILPTWEKIALKGDLYREESTLYFEGDIIKKYIVSTKHNYVETQYNEITRDRAVLLPKSSRGKERKLTASTLESVKPTGVYLHADNKGYLRIANHTTQTTFYSSDWERKLSQQEVVIEETIQNFIDCSPSAHLQQIKNFRHKLKRNQKFKAGDVFALKINRTEYAFGKILLDIGKLVKQNVLPEKHGLRYIMALPVLVKFYLYKSENRDINIKVLNNVPSLPSDYVMDNILLYGEYEIIGHQVLQEEDFDFPISYGKELASTSDKVFLQWGLISKSLPIKEFNKYTTGENKLFRAGSLSGNKRNIYAYYSVGFRPAYGEYELNKAFEKGKFNFDAVDHYKAAFDLRNPANVFIKEEIFAAFGLDPSLSYAENCKLTNTPSTLSFIN